MNEEKYKEFLAAIQVTAELFGYNVVPPDDFPMEPLDDAGNVVNNVYLEFEPA
jgi:hypothetical protein